MFFESCFSVQNGLFYENRVFLFDKNGLKCEKSEKGLKTRFLALFSHLFFGAKLTILPCSSMLKKWSQKEVKNVFFALFKNASTRQKGRFCPKMGVEKCVKKHVFLNSFQVLHKWSPVTRPSGDLQEDIQYLLFYPSFLMKY